MSLPPMAVERFSMKAVATGSALPHRLLSGTERAKQEKVELLIDGRDGKIRERNSFGHDRATFRASAFLDFA